MWTINRSYTYRFWWIVIVLEHGTWNTNIRKALIYYFRVCSWYVSYVGSFECRCKIQFRICKWYQSQLAWYLYHQFSSTRMLFRFELSSEIYIEYHNWWQRLSLWWEFTSFFMLFPCKLFSDYHLTFFS